VRQPVVTGPPGPVRTDIDLRDPMLFGTGDPHSAWRSLRAYAPVHWQDVPGRGGFWSVTRRREAVRVLADHRTFTSERGTLLMQLGEDDPSSGQQLPVSDPPKHSQMRLPLQRALTERAARYNDLVRVHTRRALEPGADGTPFDMSAALSLIPVIVFGELLDLPAADLPRLGKIAQMALAPDDPEHCLPGGPDKTAQRAHREAFAYFQDLVRRRSRAPGDDLVSVLLATTVDGAPMEHGSVLSNCYALLLGSTTTSQEVVKAAMLEVIRNGGYTAWAERPDLMPSAVEEAIRWASPVVHVMRYATVDTEIGGTPVAAGQAVAVWLASVNRDEEAFADAYRFDPGRTPNRHSSFGGGPHHCIGFMLAKQVVPVMLEEIFSAFADLELADEQVRHLASSFIGGITYLLTAGKPRKGWPR
jgi:cytochrome P450